MFFLNILINPIISKIQIFVTPHFEQYSIAARFAKFEVYFIAEAEMCFFFFVLYQVEYLCEQGADVNRGQRSSSLHYAACFGRPAVAKVSLIFCNSLTSLNYRFVIATKPMVKYNLFQTLLRHGANPDLRDEDGKTPMDKARERNDEGHREVVHILQSPGTN